MADGHGIDFGVSGSTPGLPSAALGLRRSSNSLGCGLSLFKFQNMLIVLQILLASIATVSSSPTVYDQRQTGKTNVRVELKDAVIIAVGDGEFGGDYDYHYDYSDLTIKPSPPTASTSASSSTAVPPKSTTQKVTTSTVTTTTTPQSSNTAVNITQNAAVVLEAENNSIIFPASVKPGPTEPIKIKPSEGYRPDQIPVLVLHEVHRPNKFLPVKTVEKEQKEPEKTFSAKELPMRHCSEGFFLDNHNRCKRIRRPTRERPQLPIGLRFDHRPLSRS